MPRATAPQDSERCQGRLTKWSSKRPFGDGKHFFTLELRCSNVKSADDLCEKCAARPRESKFQDKILHARIRDPIPQQSYIYGGPRYVEFCARYGEPSGEHVEAAVEAHKLAIEGYPDIEMAKKGREATRRGRPSQSKQSVATTVATAAHTRTHSTSTPPIAQPTIAASAVEISKKPQLIEVETVKAWKQTLPSGQQILVDEQGRKWALDEKGFPSGLII
jgi:hypothetical protein